MKIISINITGINAGIKEGLKDFIHEERPDVICLQDIRTGNDILMPNYEGYFSKQVGGRYNGTATYSLKKAINFDDEIKIDEIDNEGRFQFFEFEKFNLINIHAPYGEDMRKKIAFFQSLFEFISKKEKENMIICGDFKIAHKNIDISDKYDGLGFSQQERKILDKLEEIGFIDCFRELNPNSKEYTWDSRKNSFRFEYIFINTALRDKLKKASIIENESFRDKRAVFIELNDL
ncbi:MAG: hypothetical protein LBM26_05525 [Methanobrevibacter sp.]|jgi:exodeoxyribonuclease-3|nr:hypothetical protein [Methanobrevibacter sp.]